MLSNSNFQDFGNKVAGPPAHIIRGSTEHGTRVVSIPFYTGTRVADTENVKQCGGTVTSH
jgi:hypothetical protein